MAPGLVPDPNVDSHSSQGVDCRSGIWPQDWDVRMRSSYKSEDGVRLRRGDIRLTIGVSVFLFNEPAVLWAGLKRDIFMICRKVGVKL